MGEFIGARLTVHRAPGWTPVPFEGVVVDETRNTFEVCPLSGGPTRRLPKAGLEGTFAWHAHAICFKGNELRHRPEDRIKRLAPTGRSRRP
jgi:ribonuclease P protein subunit POP4